MNLPTGTITFLFTDIEGSTRQWDAHPEAMGAAVRRHDALMREAIESHGGIVFKTVGDAFCAAFPTALGALTATLAAQRALVSESWEEPTEIRVRMALHTGAAEERDGDYFGTPLNRVARLLSLGHGGQVLLSRSTQELVQDSLPPDASLLDLGQHHLRDLSRPEQVFQLRHPDLPPEFAPLKSLDHLPNNLPRQLTSFIGREHEMAQVKALLQKTSLLTLTGSGGCGKTRLALQVAADVLEAYPDGVWLVELAALSDPALVAQTVAGVLGVREESGKPLVQTLQEFFKSKRVLLLLDNCEHVLDACAQLSDTLLKHCPQVQILTSSREGLGIAGEQTYRVPSLSLPSQPTPLTPESLSRYEAVRLFIERALAVQPQFALTAANAASLAQACVHLDGIPLAIELAAARVRALSVEEINTRLDNRFRLLTGGSRTALPRHQTLRALIDWSYNLLNDPEKILLHRLSVFAGGWTLEAAGAVCAGEGIEDWEVVDLLTSLVDKSLVVAEAQEERTRYRLLATVHQYARDRLVESGESDAVRERHRDYFLGFAKEASSKLTGSEQGEWFERLEEEHENLRAALEWSLAGQDEIAPREGLRHKDEQNPAPPPASVASLRLCGALLRFWHMRGHFAESREWCVRALGQGERHERNKQRAIVLDGLGTAAWYQGDYAVARGYYEEGLAIRREVGDQRGIAGSLHNLGMVACSQGDYALAQDCYEQGLAIMGEIGDQHSIGTVLHNLGNVAFYQGDYASARVYHEQGLTIRREIGDEWGIASSLDNLGAVADRMGDYASARAYHEQSLAIRREIGNAWGIALSLRNLGTVAYRRGDDASARAYFEESLAIFQEIGDRSGIALSLEAFAGLASKASRSGQSAVLWGAAEALREAIGSPLPPNEREQYDRDMSEISQDLGEEAFSAAWAQGRTMTMEQAIEYAPKAAGS